MKYIYSLRQAMDELITEKQAYILGEDVADPYGGAFKVTKGLSVKHPGHVIPTPMCEQGITAFSIGMALAGDYVIEEIMFGDFITLAADQLINHAAKFYDLYGQKLHLAVRAPSGGYRGYGATHSQSLEKMFLGVPGLDVVAANIFCDPGKLLKSVLEKGKPALFIENKLDYPKEILVDNFDIYQMKVIQNCVSISIKGEDPEWSIVAYGGISEFAVDVSKKLLFDKEISSEVIVVSWLSDIPSIISAVKARKVLVIEEGIGMFGWGCQVAQVLAERGKSAWHMGASESCIPTARRAEEAVLIQKEDIIQYILKKEAL